MESTVHVSRIQAQKSAGHNSIKVAAGAPLTDLADQRQKMPSARNVNSAITPQLTVVPSVAPRAAVQASPGAAWLTPASIRNFYGINSMGFLDDSFSGEPGLIRGDGTGQTIAIIDWGHDPNIAADLDHFDQQFNVDGQGATPSLYTQYGASANFLTTYAQSSADSQFYLASAIPGSLPADAGSLHTSFEISLDVEWAHAIAPGARIALVEAQSSSVADLTAAINYAKAISGVSVVSMSFGVNDALSHINDSDLSQAGVTFVASTGDHGSYADPVFYSDLSGTVSGTGLGGTSDSYTAQPYGNYTQDFFFSTRVDSITTATQAGISIRNGTNGFTGNVANVSILTQSGGAGAFQYRTATAGSTTSTSIAAATAGNFLGVQRQGTTFTTYTSTDGATWTEAGHITVPSMSGAVTIDLLGAGSGSNNLVSFSSISHYIATVATNSPATSPNVVAVGGTIATTNGAGTITGESSVWGNGLTSYWFGRGGGGYSSFETRPAFQNGVSSNPMRSIPDVSLIGGTPVAVYNTDTATPTLPWESLIGTSFSAPAWAGLFAIINQGRALVGLPMLTSSQTLVQPPPTTQALLYSLPLAALGGDLHDIQSESIGSYAAGAGYDLATGLGTPANARALGADMSSWVQNPDFELGSFSSGIGLGWTSSGTATVDATGQGFLLSKYAAKIGSTSTSSSISQVISGLQPNTTYIATVWGKKSAAGSPNATFSVQNYAGPLAPTLTALPLSNTLYDKQKIVFTTGPASTSATITVSRASGSGSFYIDNVSLNQVAPAYNWGFENGSLYAWTSSGTTAVAAGAGQSGNYAAKIGGTAGTSSISEIFGGFQTGVTYNVSVFGKVDAGSATLTGPGGGSATFNTNTYQQKSFTFTGSTGMLMNFTLSSSTGTDNYAYFDNFIITQI